MKLETKVFELRNSKYANLSELARAMEISVSQIYRVREGRRNINQKFIIGAMQAFPGHKLDDLFYIVSERRQDDWREKWLRQSTQATKGYDTADATELSAKLGVSSLHLGRIETSECFPSARIMPNRQAFDFEESELFSLAGFLSTIPSDDGKEKRGDTVLGLDTYVAKVLAEEPLEVSALSSGPHHLRVCCQKR